MGKLCPISLAGVGYASNFYIFMKPDLTGCGPWVSSLIVLVAVGLILLEQPLYPRKLRALMPFCDCVVQYLIAVFLIEYIMGCFWFSLERAVLALLPKIADNLEEMLMKFDTSCHLPCEVLRKEGLGIIVSYTLSLMILVCALHATRTIDLRLLFTCPSEFFTELYQKTQNRFNRLTKSLPGMRRRGSRVSFRPGKPRKPGCCSSDDAFEFEPGYDTVPTSDTEDTYDRQQNQHHRQRR